MSLDEPAPRPRGLAALFAAIDDGQIIRAAFTVMLAGTLTVLYIDYKELMEANAAVSVMPDMPVLPAFDPEAPAISPGPQVTSDPAALRAPLVVSLKGGGILEMTGTIDPGAAARVAAELDAHGEYIKTVKLDSPGGVVDEAIKIGETIRERGYATLVAPGQVCASSCPLVFAAGVARTAAPGAVIGVHQIYAALSPGELPQQALRAAGVAMSDTQRMTASISRYLTKMGVDPALWLNALETPPDRLYYLSAAELERYRLVTPKESVASTEP